MVESPYSTRRCPYCGSENVGADATASWNRFESRWELNDIFDDAWCNDCEREFAVGDLIEGWNTVIEEPLDE